MQRLSAPNPELTLPCGLCGHDRPASQVPMRGRLNFCQACASGRSAECLALLNGGKTPRGRSVALTVLTIGFLAIAAWWGVNAYRSHDLLFFRKMVGSPSGSSKAPGHVPGTASSPASGPADAGGGGLPWFQRIFSAKPLQSVVDVGHINLLYVTQPGTDSRMGLSSQLFATREAPNDVSAKLVTEVGADMQTSFDEGLRYVRKLPREWERDFSIRLSFEDKFTSKDGGSAGTGFTIAMLAAIQAVALDPDVAVTGDVTVDGTVQPVGGVVEKLRGAIAGKCRIALIPGRNSRDAIDLALIDGTSPLWEIQIFSIGTIDEAMGLARRDRAQAAQDAIARFNALRARLPSVVTPNYLQSPVVQTELREVLRLAPNHLSAATLLSAASGQLPRELSLNRSVEEILATSHLFVAGVINPKTKSEKSSGEKGITVFPEREFGQCTRTLQRLTPILDPQSIDLKTKCIAYASALRTTWTYQPPDLKALRTRQQWAELERRERGFQQQAKDDLEDARSRLLLALRKLDTDGSLMAELTKK